VASLLLVQVAACLWGSFRADDWLNLERGARAWSQGGWIATWTAVNPFGLYRPLIDLWHGGLLRLFGLQAPPMMMTLIALLLLQSLLLARLVRARGGSRQVAALAAAALWAQPNTYSWTTLWVSNATGALMVTAALATLVLHARVTRRLASGQGVGLNLLAMSLTMLFGALCKEDIVLLPAIVVVLELARAPRMSAAERRASITAVGALLALAAAYAAFRLLVLPAPQPESGRYHLSLGVHVVRNVGFFALHLGALPMVAFVLARWRFPDALSREGAALTAWVDARREILAGIAWAAIATALYLPISGRPAFGYLLPPALGIAYAVAHFLGAVSAVAAPAERPRSPVWTLAAHALIAVAVTAGALASIGWHRFGSLQREMVRTLEHDRLPPGSHVGFIDAGVNETPSRRTLFNLMVSSDPTAFLHVALGRPDLTTEVRVLPGARTVPADAVTVDPWYVARSGALVPAQRSGP